MSTPAGWYRQEDGRDRFWDGQQWTDQFRDPQGAAAPAAAVGAAPAAKKGGLPKKHLIGYGATGFVALLIGAGIGASGSGDSTANVSAGSTPTATTTVHSTVTTTVTPPARTTVTKVATVRVTPVPKAAITEGVWEVGVDIKPGRYKVIDPIQDQCYWEINPTAKPDDIVANDNVTGGRPVVQLRKGQTFTNDGCGDWARVG